MRILMAAACPLPWPRGTPIRIHRIAEALTQRGHDVHVITYPLGDESQDIPYTTHRVAENYKRLNPAPGPSLTKLLYLDPLLCGRIRKFIQSESVDIVHAHHYEGLIASLAARRLSKPVPIIYDAHTLLHSELPHYRFGLPRRLSESMGRAMDRTIPPRADHVIAVTDRMQQWFTANTNISRDRISVIPNGVEVENFARPTDVDTGRSACPNVVFAGNLAAYQGVDLLLQAFRRVHDISSDTRLSLLTDSDTTDVKSMIDKLGITDAVTFLNPDYTELPQELAKADVLVNPRTECDGIPQKLLNYMATGRPIVSFAGSSALLTHAADALIVPDGDTKGFADAILRVTREPELAQALGQAARSKVLASYSWQMVAERVEAVYCNLAGSST
jgi:glycosyltransferase involved in cell wall biosynthesis